MNFDILSSKRTSVINGGIILFFLVSQKIRWVEHNTRHTFCVIIEKNNGIGRFKMREKRGSP